MMIKIILKIISLCIVFFTFSPVFAFDITIKPDLSIYPDQQNISLIVIYGKNEGEGHLEITNKSDKDVTLEIKASVLKHEESSKVANLNFISGNYTKSHLNIGLRKGETKIVTYKVSNINVPGEFTGTIEMKIAAKPSKFISVKALKCPSLPVILVEAKDRNIEFSMDKPDKRHFQFSFKNPDSDKGFYRKIQVNELILRDNGKVIKGAVSTENPVTLEPGETKNITIYFPEIPKGNYTGILALRDEYTYQEYITSLNSPYIPLTPITAAFKSVFKREWILVFAIVLSGAVASLLLKLLPRSAERKKNREKITELEKRIESLCSFEPGLRTKFGVELVRARTLNDNTKIYTPSAKERFETIKATLERIERYLNIREEISKVYIDIDSRDFLPFSKEQEIRTILRDADLYLYQDKTDIAENKIKEANELQEFGPDKEHLMEQYCKDLQEDIQKLFGRIKEIKGDEYIEKVKRELKEESSEEFKTLQDEKALKEKIKDKKFREKLRQWDLKYNKLDIYYNKFLPFKEILKEKFEAQHEKVIGFLRSDSYKYIQDAITHCESLKLGVTEEMIEKAISDKKFHIETNPVEPSINRLVTFWLQFEEINERDLNDSPLRDKFRYVWNFGDRTTEAQGIEVTHYFKRRGPLILARKWFRRNWIILFKKWQVWDTFRVTVNVSKLEGNGAIYNKNDVKDVKVHEPIEKEYRSGITLLDVFAFVFTLILSCVIAVATTYEENYSLKSFKDFLTPFLLGFGLDISADYIKGKAATIKGGK